MISNKSWLTCLVLLGTVIAVAAQKPTGEQRFAGTWHAKFQGNTFSTLKLLVKDNRLTGSMTGANINVDKDENLTSAQARARSATLSSPEIFSRLPRKMRIPTR